MKCDRCTKKATVHLTEIIDGKAMEMHLCEECAREQSQNMEQQFGLADLLAGLTDFGKKIPEVSKTALQCPQCGLSYDDFRKFGRFGCAGCYDVFRPHLKSLFKKIHGSIVHLGKKPVLQAVPNEKPPAAADAPVALTAKPAGAAAPAEPLSELEQLKLALQEAVRREDFEQAALLRDRIRQMEQSG